jgi:hypothetical protein
MKKEYILQAPFSHHVSKWRFQQFIVDTVLKQLRNLFPDNYSTTKWVDFLRERVEASTVDALNNQDQSWSYGYSICKWNKDLTLNKFNLTYHDIT